MHCRFVHTAIVQYSKYMYMKHVLDYLSICCRVVNYYATRVHNVCPILT